MISRRAFAVGLGVAIIAMPVVGAAQQRAKIPIVGILTSNPLDDQIFAFREGLRELGYESVYNLVGGFNSWKDRGLPWVADRQFTQEELTRYSRHFVIPEVGEKGQAKLLDSKVLLLGTGALGSPSALYLAAAGVGTIGLIDFDVVDASNLQRQIIHTTDRVGMLKTESAQKSINALNPGVKVIRHDVSWKL